MKKISRRSSVILAFLAAGLLAGCAGDLSAARDTAKKGAAFVGDMQKATTDAISRQRDSQQASAAEAAALLTEAQLDQATTNRHAATWQSDKSDDSQALLKAMLALTADSDLPKSAPFIVMTPLPAFNSPAIDDKSFSDVIAKFNKLSKALSPIDRAQALIPFIQAAAKAYKDSAKGAASKAPTGDAKTNNVGVNSLATAFNDILSLTSSGTGTNDEAAKAADVQKNEPAKAANLTTEIPADDSPTKGLDADNETLVNGLTNAMSLQP